MSSAILYVAIVAIWACVLIPRWLRRTPSVSAPSSSDVVTDQDEASAPSPHVSDSPESSLAPTAQAQAPVAQAPEDPEAFEAVEDVGAAGGSKVPEVREVPGVPRVPEAPEEKADKRSRRDPLTREESRRRMLAARRRLLMLLLALETAACLLPALGLAALWVVFPPTIMLLGYMLLLREASKADREHAEREFEAEAAHARAEVRSHGRATTATAAPATPSARPPTSPGPEEYEDLGHARDFAPGLAGKYTTSNDEDVVDLSNYKRAVGD
jgi:hypothetical protein